MTPEEWLSKAEWEGGVEAAFDYGLHEGEISEEYPRFRQLVFQARIAYGSLMNAIGEIESYEVGERETK